MGLKLRNTLSGNLEEFKPLSDTVRIYSCGLTVQGPPHVGHIRAAMTRDILRRWLEYSGYKVKSIENFTDVDDKIINKQKELKSDWRIIAEENIQKYILLCEYLNILKPHFYPRASQHIEEIISLIQRLIEKGLAYEKSGDVYYRVRKFPEYGKLSKKSIDELQAGARIEPTEFKEDPLDFALWKSAKPGEPYWLSPWGKGRPGWHIECSAMSMHYLGESFDIHTGGEDLIFPHHENEIAQSEGATGKDFVRYWLHNGMVNITGEKMSKSTGRYFLMEDIIKDFSPNVIRLFLLKTHYRSPIEFSRERLEEARAAFNRIQTFLEKFKEPVENFTLQKLEEFTEAMNDDLNTPKALGIIFELVNKGYETGDPQFALSVKRYLNILGFVEDKRTLDDISPKLIKLLLDVRNKLRQNRQYELSDEIRNRLNDLGIIVDDKKDKSTYRWEVK
jgi:cysteinyl-tRNA synthetase|uniref:Cysteine--tRNA ligase n=1 Tax=candidate division WOR-3 bacterium TaxID=2052148 RepID=A0A7V3RHE3_UNCW3